MGRRCPVLVGRDDELAALRARWSLAARGRGGLVAVRGEAGIGKSRLANELATEVADGGAVVAIGRASPGTVQYPYQPLIEVAMQLTRDRPLPTDRRGGTAWPDVIESLLAGEVGRDAGAWPLLQREAIVRLVRWVCADRPLLVVLEDLHWADPDTLAAIDYLADNLRDTATMWVATMRTGEPSAAATFVEHARARDVVGVLDLRRLPDGEVDEMLRVLAPDVGTDEVGRIRAACEGLPFLVEELVDGAGLPSSFAEAVRDRIAALDGQATEVLVVAALLGPTVDWQLLSAATGSPPDAVAAAVEVATGVQLLVHDEGGSRFRHALTREAVLAAVVPPRRALLAQRALAALDNAGMTDTHLGVAAVLAAAAGDRARAGALLAAAGESALAQGALATAIDALTQAVAQLPPGAARAQVRARHVEGLALAGRAEEAAEAGRRAVAELENVGAPTDAVHLHLAMAAVEAARWNVALDHIAGVHDDALRPQAIALEAEARYASGAVERAVELARRVVDDPAAAPVGRCRAWLLLGRAARVGDLGAARAAFEQAVAIAEHGGLPAWRLRALHELATIELLAEGTTELLREARLSAQALGALSTVGWLDVQLAAAAHLHFDLDEAARYADEGVELGERLGLPQLRAMGLWFRAEDSALRGDRIGMESALADALAAAPGDPEMEGMAWAGARGMAALLAGERATAIELVGKGMARLPTKPEAPGHYRGMWPLLLAVADDPSAAAAMAEARALGIDEHRINRGLLGAADAVLRGRRGDRSASAVLDAARADLRRYPVWREVALLLAAEAAVADGWGDPRGWAAEARDGLLARGFAVLAAQADEIVSPREARWVALGITAREGDVLALIAEGLANKEVAGQLSLSVRTVEKHVEALLRKTACSSRAQLIAYVHR